MAGLKRGDRAGWYARAMRFRWRAGHAFQSAELKTSGGRQLHCELLEDRMMLSASPWTAMSSLPAANLAATSYMRATDYDMYSLNVAQMHGLLDATGSAEISLPNPDGTIERFTFSEASVMAPELAA